MIFDPILDFFRGKAITIPPLDGAFRANTALDDAPVLAALHDADNLCAAGGRIFASSDTRLVSIEPDGRTDVIETFPSAISAIAARADGALAVALENGMLVEHGVEMPLPGGADCITSLAYEADGTLWLTNGSSRHPPSGWVADLMEKNAAGSVWRRAPGGEFHQVAGGLAWPNGLFLDGRGVVVSESWRHRLVRLEETGPVPVLSHLPGYPARLSPAEGGGAWLSIFAPRNRLIELVLQEHHYRLDMMAEVPRDFWIAPSLASGRSFLEPLQCGGIRTMGEHKAWAPSRSHGLVVRLDSRLAPLYSVHSRANGQRHGTCSAIEADSRLMVASRGSGAILDLDAGGPA
jgi:hypothetical protein